MLSVLLYSKQMRDPTTRWRHCSLPPVVGWVALMFFLYYKCWDLTCALMCCEPLCREASCNLQRRFSPTGSRRHRLPMSPCVVMEVHVLCVWLDGEGAARRVLRPSVLNYFLSVMCWILSIKRYTWWEHLCVGVAYLLYMWWITGS